jgi:predicted DNA-binding transcriptional regulator AlpA
MELSGCSRQVSRTPCRVKRAAELLGKTVEATYQDVARGRVPYRRLGRTLVFFEEEILEFLDSQPGVRVEQVLGNSE